MTEKVQAAQEATGGRVFTLRELARATGKTDRQIRYLIRTGRLPFHRSGNRLMVKHADARHLLAHLKVSVDVDSSAREPLSTLPEFMEIRRDPSGAWKTVAPVSSPALGGACGRWRICIQRPDGGELTIGLPESQNAEAKALVLAFLGASSCS